MNGREEKNGRIRKKKDGFSLIEVLIVLAITVWLSSYAILYGKTAQNQTAMYVDGAKVGETILRAKGLAISTFDNPNPTQSCGYGVAVNYATQVVTLFSYEPAGAPAACSSIGTISSANPPLVPISTFVLDSGVTFQTGNNNMYYVLFIPPNPQVLISDVSTGVVGVNPGVLTLAAGGATVVINISSAGEVDFP